MMLLLPGEAGKAEQPGSAQLSLLPHPRGELHKEL